MKCPKCNCEIADNVQFCHCCGVDLIHAKLITQDDKAKGVDPFEVFVYLILFFILGSIIIFGISITLECNDNPQNTILSVVAIIILIISAIFCSKIKNLVLKVARWLLDFSTTVDVLTGLTILISGIFICQDTGFNYWWFVLGAFLYSLIALVKDYALYLLVDIRDSLKILADKAKNIDNK